MGSLAVPFLAPAALCQVLFIEARFVSSNCQTLVSAIGSSRRRFDPQLYFDFTSSIYHSATTSSKATMSFPPTSEVSTQTVDANTNPYKAQRLWPPDFDKLHPKHQFRLERRYRRRAKLKYTRPQWTKAVKLTQWGAGLCEYRSRHSSSGLMGADLVLQLYWAMGYSTWMRTEKTYHSTEYVFSSTFDAHYTKFIVDSQLVPQICELHLDSHHNPTTKTQPR